MVLTIITMRILILTIIIPVKKKTINYNNKSKGGRKTVLSSSITH